MRAVVLCPSARLVWGNCGTVRAMPQRPSITASTLLLLSLPPFFWATNAIIGRMVAGSIGPLTLNTFRWLIAGVILLPFGLRALIAHRAVITARWRSIAMMSFFGVGCFNSLQYLALHTSTALNVTLIGSAGPVFIVLVGAWFFDEPLKRRQLLGAALSMVGVAWVMSRGEIDQLARLNANVGDLYMLAATLCWSFYTWLLRKHRPVELSLSAMLLLQIIVGVALFAPLTAVEILLGHMPTQWDGRTLGIFVYIALFPALLSYLCWDRGVARVGATLPIFFSNFTPVFTALMSAFLLDEMPQPYHAVGLALILAGIRFARR